MWLGCLSPACRMLDNYFQSVCRVKVDMNDINMKNIGTLSLILACLSNSSSAAKTGEVEDLLCLLELIVGAAFLCEDKIRFITNIMGLNPTAQEVLKGLFEHFQGRQEELGEEDPEGDAAAGLGDSEEGFEEETFTKAGDGDDDLDLKTRNISSMDTPSVEAAVR